jgi:transposase InsO family protein
LLIKEIFDRGKGKWGWRTIQMKLKAQYDIVMNHKKIERIKKQYGLITQIRKRNPYKMFFKKTREHRCFPNILNRQFQQLKPRTTFCTDITFLHFGQQTAYLSAVKDIASREIVSWSISPNLQMELVFSTLNNLKKCLIKKQILLHSDQGFHYTSPDFVHRVKALNLVQSMSRKGNCTDNAPMESFFGHFKDEVEYKNCQSFQEIKQLTASYINYYNNERKQWNLNKMTPVEYRRHLLRQSS